MKQSTCGAVFSQPGGDELKHDIGAQCGATAYDRTVQVPVIVNQTQNSTNPTQQLVVGSRPSRPSKYTKTLTGKVSKTVKVETVRKMTPPSMPTTVQVIGTVVLDPIDYAEFVQTFNAPRQNIEQ